MGRDEQNKRTARIIAEAIIKKRFVCNIVWCICIGTPDFCLLSSIDNSGEDTKGAEMAGAYSGMAALNQTGDGRRVSF